MLDHALGRPSPSFKRLQVLFLSFILSVYIKRSQNPPFLLRWIDEKLKATAPWKIITATTTALYLLQNILLVFFMHGPDPLTRMYTRNYFRVTWIFTSLDAGFLSAMNIRPIWLRDILSVLLSFGYFLFPDAAQEKVKRYIHNPTTDIIRTTWEKGLNPYLRLFTFFDRGYLKIRKNILISLPNETESSFKDITKSHVKARLYFDGSLDQLKQCDKLIFHVPGGGFVAMPPETHDDYVSEWARQTKIPIVSINYGKAPEHPYPWALEECFEAYKSIVQSNGRVIGIGEHKENKNVSNIKIVMIGDSAGSNIVTGTLIKLIQKGGIQMPCGLISLYPCYSFDLECWMKPADLNLLKSDSHQTLTQAFLNYKEFLRKDAPLCVQDAPKSIDVLANKVDDSPSFFDRLKPKSFRKEKEPYIHSYLSMTSRMYYFGDRILTPEYMRTMAILYLAESPLIPDLRNDYFLSPILAPEEILAQFPKVYLLCGEKDPFVDDTIIFGNKIKEAKRKANYEWEMMSERRKSIDSFKSHRTSFSHAPEEMVTTRILPGMSHGIFQMYSLLPEAKQATRLTSQWILKLFKQDLDADHEHLTLGIEETNLLQQRRKSLAMRVAGNGNT